jgi:hypothetical protein
VGHRFTRRELYDLVWSEPVRALAQRFQLSDVGFAKICRKAGIPRPPRGFWAKLAAGKRVSTIPFPPRGPGMADLVEIEPPRARWRAGLGATHLPGEPEVLPPPPSLPVEIQQLIEETRAAIGRVPMTRDLSVPHPLIAKALAKDEERRQKMLKYGYSWDKPLLESPLEKRRLRLLQSLFLALEGQHCRPSMRPKYARDLSVRVGDIWVGFSLDYPEWEADHEPWRFRGRQRLDSEQLSFKISLETSYAFQTEWVDSKEDHLETHLADMAVHLIASSEILLEQAIKRDEEWERRRIEDDLKKKRERAIQLERAKMRKLYRDARNWHRAERLRAYVAAVTAAAGMEAPSDGQVHWRTWALAEANRVDPLMSLEFDIVAPKRGDEETAED